MASEQEISHASRMHYNLTDSDFSEEEETKEEEEDEDDNGSENSVDGVCKSFYYMCGSRRRNKGWSLGQVLDPRANGYKNGTECSS
ncbi:hypothetical protein FNV43_RR04034 [Rhamnella rubrinervis]|uniref:Uncharacterized protein n=1 Tax=Rhamnella rubrinervis TaxID=2594499 RepID=A0A8K0HJY8_9ROSA|nr:hypothetical protein FNV43_RR04034 [Rhamnella rubrinervis]